MMVTSITPVDKKKSKVFLEEGFAFVLYRGEVERFGIEEGKELEEAVYRRILDEVLLGRAKERALYLLKSSGKTESWMKKKAFRLRIPRRCGGLCHEFPEGVWFY